MRRVNAADIEWLITRFPRPGRTSVLAPRRRQARGALSDAIEGWERWEEEDGLGPVIEPGMTYEEACTLVSMAMTSTVDASDPVQEVIAEVFEEFAHALHLRLLDSSGSLPLTAEGRINPPWWSFTVN